MNTHDYINNQYENGVITKEERDLREHYFHLGQVSAREEKRTGEVREILTAIKTLEIPLELSTENFYKLSEDSVGSRIWMMVYEPGGDKKADIGIMFNDEGVSIDVYDGNPEYPGATEDPIIQPYLLWGSDFKVVEKST